MFTFLMLGSGLFWTITYLLIIRRSALDHTYGMPLVALCANISWEFIFSFLFPPGLIQHLVDLVWFSLDVLLFLQLIRYGPKEFADLSKRLFFTIVILAVATSFCTILFTTMEFHDKGTYAAFGQNLLMSILFLTMLHQRGSLRGQSISIAVCKLIGTACASLAFFLNQDIPHNFLLFFLYLAIFFYDGIYVFLVVRQQRILAIMPGVLVSSQEHISG